LHQVIQIYGEFLETDAAPRSLTLENILMVNETVYSIDFGLNSVGSSDLCRLSIPPEVRKKQYKKGVSEV